MTTDVVFSCDPEYMLKDIETSITTVVRTQNPRIFINRMLCGDELKLLDGPQCCISIKGQKGGM
jgi:hypothetical protein